MATYKPYKKTESGKEEVKVPSSAISGLATVATSGSYNDLSDKPTIPSAVKSIDGLSGGTLTSALYLAGGDAVSGKANIQLDTDGQITAKGTTSTLFGRSSGSLLVGHNSHSLKLRGSGTRPTFNGNDMALKSDVPDTSKMVTTDTEQFITGRKYFQNHPVDFTDGSAVRVGNTVHLYDTGILLDVEDMDACPIKIGLDQDAGQVGQVLTSQGAGKTPIWATPSTGATDAVKYTAQTLTTAQKAQARTNIGAGTGNGTVTGVKVNGSTKSPDSAGLVDLGTISGGSGGATIEKNYLEGGETYTVMADTEYGSCELFGYIDCGDAQDNAYSIDVNMGNLSLLSSSSTATDSTTGTGTIWFYMKLIISPHTIAASTGKNYKTVQMYYRHTQSDRNKTVVDGWAQGSGYGATELMFDLDESYTYNFTSIKTVKYLV